ELANLAQTAHETVEARRGMKLISHLLEGNLSIRTLGHAAELVGGEAASAGIATLAAQALALKSAWDAGHAAGEWISKTFRFGQPYAEERERQQAEQATRHGQMIDIANKQGVDASVRLA